MKKIFLICIAMLSCFGSTLTAFAEEDDIMPIYSASDVTYIPSPVVGLPDIPTGPDCGNIIYRKGDIIYTAFMYYTSDTSAKSYKIATIEDGNTTIVRKDSGYFNYGLYHLEEVDGELTWVKNDLGSVKKLTLFNTDEFYYSDHDIVDIEGNLVFQGSPQLSQKLAEMVGPLVIPEITRTLGILVPCGVGLMALLMLLQLLPKVLGRFLN